MDSNTVMLFQGMGLIMEMILSTMPASLAEKWIEEVNSFNQSVTDMAGAELLPKEKE